MNNRTIPADNAAANTVDFQEQCSLGMDRAIGTEEASLPRGVRLDSSVINIYKKASWFAPVGMFFKAAAQAVGFCMEMRRSWLSQPHGLSHVSTVASNSSSQSRPSADELAYKMDIAIGPQNVTAPRRTAASSSVSTDRPQPTPDELAYSMDIAIGERFTVQSRTIESSFGGQAAAAEVPEPSRELAFAAKAGS